MNPPTDSHPGLTAFQERFLSKLQKVDSQEIERFLTEVVREKSFLQNVFDAMTDGVVVLKHNLEVQYLNSPAIELLGLNAKQKILNQRLPGILPVEDLRALLARFALAPERVENAEIWTRHGLEAVLLSVSIVPLVGGGGAILMARDITMARRAFDEQRRLQQAQTMATLSAGLAHEIKNPLNSLLLHAQLLRESVARLPTPRRRAHGGPDRERMASSAQVIVDEIVRLNSKVNEFLAAVRPTSPNFEEVRLPSLLSRILTILRPEVEAASINLVTMCDHQTPPVHADPDHLIQIVHNLVKNSIEALLERRNRRPPQSPGGSGSIPDLPPEGPGDMIEIRAEPIAENVAITVRDNGPGIPLEILPRIFEPYFTSKETGTGLGLNIVSRMVEENGGRLNVATRPLVDGTAISVLLPIRDRTIRKLDIGAARQTDGAETAIDLQTDQPTSANAQESFSPNPTCRRAKKWFTPREVRRSTCFPTYSSTRPSPQSKCVRSW